MPTIQCDSPEVIATCREAITHTVEKLAQINGHSNELTLMGARMYVVGYVNALFIQGLISIDTVTELNAENDLALKAIGAPA